FTWDDDAVRRWAAGGGWYAERAGVWGDGGSVGVRARGVCGFWCRWCGSTCESAFVGAGVARRSWSGRGWNAVVDAGWFGGVGRAYASDTGGSDCHTAWRCARDGWDDAAAARYGGSCRARYGRWCGGDDSGDAACIVWRQFCWLG